MYKYCVIKPDIEKYNNCVQELSNKSETEDFKNFVSKSELKLIKYSPKKNRCIICMNSEYPPANGEVGQLKDYFKIQLPEIKNISIEIKSKNPVPDISAYLTKNLEDILKELSNDYPLLKNAFDYNNYEFDNIENNLHIFILSSYFKKLLKRTRMDAYIEKFLNKRLLTNLKIDFKISDKEKIQAEIEEEEGKNNSEELKLPKKKSAKTLIGKIIIGKTFDDKSLITIKDLLKNDYNYKNKQVVVQGQIFHLEEKTISKDSNTYYKKLFYIDDNTEVLTCQVFGQKEFELKKGSFVMVKGKFSEDNYLNNEPFIKVSSMKYTANCARPDLAEEKRIELHTHSKMSKMDGLVEIEKYVETAAFWGHQAIAITDHGNVHIFPDFFKACKSKGIKPILGMEGYLCYSEKDYKKKSYHISLLVKNRIGLQNLYELVGLSNLNYFFKHPRIPKNLLSKYREGILVGSACSGGDLYSAIIKNKPVEEIEKIAKFYDYIEIMPVENNAHLIRSEKFPDINNETDLQNINKQIYDLGKKLNIPVVATGDVHYISDIDKISRHALHIFAGYSDTDSETLLYFKTTNEMLDEFSYLGKESAEEVVVKNPELINRMIEEVQPIPDGFYPPEIPESKDKIMEIASEKLKRIYGEKPDEIISERFKKEMDSIIENNYSSLYYLAYKLVQESLKAGYIVGSRGSVGSSFIAYLLDISEVNPLPAHYICPKCFKTDFSFSNKYTCGIDMKDSKCPDCKTAYNKDGFSVVFEVFVGFNKDKVPDIDLNFSGDYQSSIHRWVENYFGKDNVFKAGTISTLKDQTVYSVIKSYSEKMGQLTNAKKEKILKSCLSVKRTTGQHPGGMIIVPKGKKITEFTPVQYPANNKDSGNITTQFDYHKMEEQLLKLDCLGHDNPTQLKLLAEYSGKSFEDIPIPDAETTSIFSSCKALGVEPSDIGTPLGTLAIPEFNTEFVRQMLIDTKPKTITELINISGLSHGTDVWLGNAKELIKKNIPLSEVITTRDDILLFLTKLGLENGIAFRIMENVRKGKGLTGEHLKEMKKHKIPEWYIESCEKIKYLFPKAHAIAYVMMAYRIAYYKVHYPTAFYASFITIKSDGIDYKYLNMNLKELNKALKNLQLKGAKEISAKEKKDISTIEVIREMKARNVKVNPVDIYKSTPKSAIIIDDAIYPPLITLEGLGKEQAIKICESRKNGKFKSYEDFTKRAGINQTLLALMKEYNILPDLPNTNHLELF
jgi:DNA polymerase III subunit alpha, Gram-positive type